MKRTGAVKWWHKLIGRDDKFFTLLDAGANEVRTSVGLLTNYIEALNAGASPPPSAAFADSRRRQKEIRTQTITELYKTLVPPFDRDDIQALAYAMYRVPKVVEKTVERLSIYPGRLPFASFRRQAQLLTVAADAAVALVRQLLQGASIDRINDANARLQSAEGEADKMMLNLLSELYHGPYDVKELVIVQSLYEMMERAVDRCRTVGNIVVRIALKSA